MVYDDLELLTSAYITIRYLQAVMQIYYKNVFIKKTETELKLTRGI